MNKLIISNVKHEIFEGIEFIWIDYDYKDGFGTLSIDNDENEFKINKVHKDYTFYNDDFRYVCDYINNIIKGKNIKEILDILRDV